MRILSTLLLAPLLPWIARAAFHSNDTACTRHYTVQPGDTCDKIGQKTLTSTYQILAFNLLDAGADCYTLEIGSQLCLGRYGNDCQFVHQCTDQDTCESIASAYGITTQRLQSNNPSLDCNIVYDGLMLCVSAGSIRPPADNSINATDVKIAREQARQAWLLQERIKKPNAMTNGKANSKSNPKAKSHHASASSKTHSPHRHHHHHSHTSADSQHSSQGDKQTQKPDLQQAVIEPDAKLPSPRADHALSHSSDQHDRPASSSHQSQDSTSHHPASDDVNPSSHDQHDASVFSTDQLEHKFVDQLLSSSSSSAASSSIPIGSNHTPHHADLHSLPPLAGATNSPQRRHRSLSSRSHHQRSHTP